MEFWYKISRMELSFCVVLSFSLYLNIVSTTIEHTNEIIGCCDGVNISGKMKIELK